MSGRDDDLMYQAHVAAEEVLDVLVDAELEYGTCACHTCMVREVLTAAWPFLKQAAKEGYE